MHFCSECSNMYYIRISADNPNKLIYYCRNCGHEDFALNVDNLTITNTQFKKVTSQVTYINKYTKLDPTLPRINNILCPNAECLTNTKNEPREIIYIRYDDINMKYIYLCSSCNTVWKLDELTS